MRSLQKTYTRIQNRLSQAAKIWRRVSPHQPSIGEPIGAPPALHADDSQGGIQMVLCIEERTKFAHCQPLADRFAHIVDVVFATGSGHWTLDGNPIDWIGAVQNDYFRFGLCSCLQ